MSCDDKYTPTYEALLVASTMPGCQPDKSYSSKDTLSYVRTCIDARRATSAWQKQTRDVRHIKDAVTPGTPPAKRAPVDRAALWTVNYGAARFGLCQVCLRAVLKDFGPMEGDVQTWEAAHKVSHHSGGSVGFDNLMIACWTCNRESSSAHQGLLCQALAGVKLDRETCASFMEDKIVMAKKAHAVLMGSLNWCAWMEKHAKDVKPRCARPGDVECRNVAVKDGTLCAYHLKPTCTFVRSDGTTCGNPQPNAGGTLCKVHAESVAVCGKPTKTGTPCKIPASRCKIHQVAAKAVEPKPSVELTIVTDSDSDSETAENSSASEEHVGLVESVSIGSEDSPVPVRTDKASVV